MTKLGVALQEKQGDKSLRALAGEMNVAVGTAEGWVKGWRYPHIKYLPMVADYLDVEAGDIVTWAAEDAALTTGDYLSSDPFREAA